MRRRRTLCGATLAVLLAGAVGTGAAADTYPPPAAGAGKAAPTRVKQGHCTHFSGDGFANNTMITVYDDEKRYGNTSSGDQGEFVSRVCFKADARVGNHVLAARGANGQTLPSDPAQREVTAAVTVVGAEQSASADEDVDSANAASTTSLTEPFPLAAAGLLLVPVISGLLLLFERRHRRRRRAA